MEMPRPTEAHAFLERIAGHWEGEETIAPSPWDAEGGTAQATVANRLDLGGFVVIQDYVQKRGDTVSFAGHSVWSYDAATDEYCIHWWDTMGMAPNLFRGKRDGDTLTLDCAGPPGRSRVTYEIGDGRYDFKMEVSPDGESFMGFMSGSYIRKA